MTSTTNDTFQVAGLEVVGSGASEHADPALLGKVVASLMQGSVISDDHITITASVTATAFKTIVVNLGGATGNVVITIPVTAEFGTMYHVVVVPGGGHKCTLRFSGSDTCAYIAETGNDVELVNPVLGNHITIGTDEANSFKIQSMNGTWTR